MEEIDAWRSTQLLIKQFGEGARFVAAQKADALLAKGDVDGFHAWVRIGHAINDLERPPPNAIKSEN